MSYKLLCDKLTKELHPFKHILIADQKLNERMQAPYESPISYISSKYKLIDQLSLDMETHKKLYHLIIGLDKQCLDQISLEKLDTVAQLFLNY